MPKACIEKNPTRGWILRNLGFITDQNQINVALTRARKGLIIIGKFETWLSSAYNFGTLRYHDLWLAEESNISQEPDDFL